MEDLMIFYCSSETCTHFLSHISLTLWIFCESNWWQRHSYSITGHFTKTVYKQILRICMFHLYATAVAPKYALWVQLQVCVLRWETKNQKHRTNDERSRSKQTGAECNHIVLMLWCYTQCGWKCVCKGLKMPRATCSCFSLSFYT